LKLAGSYVHTFSNDVTQNFACAAADHEVQREATGSLSLRQTGWLENKLDGRRKRKTKSTASLIDDVGAMPDQQSEIIQFSTMDCEMERRVDAMISSKPRDPGKTAVDLTQLDELEAAIDSLKRAVRSMR
jgi:hypothetical protein